ncbi:MAG TPA: glycosyltransferase family 4 protein, partial [Gemmatimonadaceae bacterium]|nr:glycosyltransferase family 4 protein [Gemmatimonadaceae bacterium]
LIGAPDSPLVKRAQAAGLAVAAIPMIADWDLRAARRIRARMKAWRADVVHAHDARSHALALLALLGSKTPLVVTRRVVFPPKSVGLKYGERVTRFIAISNAVRDAMVSRGIAPERIVVVHSGVKLPSSDVSPRDWRTELGWPADTVVCGVIGAMTPEKGLDSLEKIAAALPPDVRARAGIVLLGGSRRGSTSIGGIPAHFAGFVDAIESATAGLDILLHPSRSEGLGTSVIDAMALGVTPVGFAVGGLPELIEPGAGFLVPSGDTRAFAEQAAALIRDRALRTTTGAAARERAKKFGSERMAEETEAVYQSVLKG